MIELLFILWFNISFVNISWKMYTYISYALMITWKVFYHTVNSETCSYHYKTLWWGNQPSIRTWKEPCAWKIHHIFLELTSFFFASLLISSSLLEECFRPRVVACCTTACWKQKLFRVWHFIKLLPPKEFQYGDIKSEQFWFWNESVNKKRIVAQCKPGENTVKSWDREIIS